MTLNDTLLKTKDNQLVLDDSITTIIYGGTASLWQLGYLLYHLILHVVSV